MQTKRNGGTHTIEEVAKHWKENRPHYPLAWEVGSKWAYEFTKEQREKK